MLRDRTIAIKVLQKLYPLEKEIKERVAVKVTDTPYVLHEIFPKLAGKEYLDYEEYDIDDNEKVKMCRFLP